ncbi:MAG: formate dehydrogenase accessory sulfurtransferase FdhD [Chloroflexi bacterium]|nr:formate dehydrogenase accessory sulfurtransferase FdhD [Chloroflexota bacterium]
MNYISITAGSPQTITADVVEEAQVCLSVNGQELTTWMCSPHQLEWLVLGFLANEGVIRSLADVHHVHMAKSGRCLDVWLNDTAVTLPSRRIITAGCGGGVTFDDLSQKHEPLATDLTTSATAAQIAELMRQVHLGAEKYQRTRGIHTAALANPDKLLIQVEDIGRHNCIDKLRGAAMQQGIATRGLILLSSGRISSEMLNKARQMEIPLVCSRTSPTSLSVALAEAWHIAIVGYIRQDRMRLYTHPQRVLEVVY